MIKVSAKTGKGIEECFTKIVKMLMKRATTGENTTQKPKTTIK